MYRPDRLYGSVRSIFSLHFLDFPLDLSKTYKTFCTMTNDFLKFATAQGLNSMHVEKVMSSSASAIQASAGYISPTILEERQLNVTQMDVFSRLMMDRVIFLGTEVNDYTANVIQAQLLYLDSVDSERDINLYLNTPGGSVYAGLGIYDTMQFVQAKVATICTGLAASMGAVLLVAGEKGMRAALPHSRVMIHQPLGGIQGQASDIEITAKEILKLKEELYQIISNHSGRSMGQIRQDADRDHWMTAAEAQEYGMIDRVYARRKQ